MRDELGQSFALLPRRSEPGIWSPNQADLIACPGMRSSPGSPRRGGVRRVYFKKTIKPTPEQTVQRYEHYELAMGEDGKPEELRRGAMG
jgi:hypothetical protein